MGTRILTQLALLAQQVRRAACPPRRSTPPLLRVTSSGQHPAGGRTGALLLCACAAAAGVRLRGLRLAPAHHPAHPRRAEGPGEGSCASRDPPRPLPAACPQGPVSQHRAAGLHDPNVAVCVHHRTYAAGGGGHARERRVRAPGAPPAGGRAPAPAGVPVGGRALGSGRAVGAAARRRRPQHAAAHVERAGEARMASWSVARAAWWPWRTHPVGGKHSALCGLLCVACCVVPRQVLSVPQGPAQQPHLQWGLERQDKPAIEFLQDWGVK